jgi:hypothetical protein
MSRVCHTSRESTDPIMGTVVGTSAETSLELVPRPTQKSQTSPWMTVRPQHHRRPLPRPQRHWRRLLYNLPHLISLLSLLFRPRHREKETVPTTLSAQMSAAVGSLYGFPSDSSLSFFDILISLSISSCLHRGQWQHSVPRQLSRQPALCSPNFQCSPPSSSSPCHRSCSPVTPTTMTQPDIPLSRISLAVARYGP